MENSCCTSHIPAMSSAAAIKAFERNSLFWFGHGCSGHRMLLERERYYDLGIGWHGCSSKGGQCGSASASR